MKIKIGLSIFWVSFCLLSACDDGATDAHAANPDDTNLDSDSSEPPATTEEALRLSDEHAAQVGSELEAGNTEFSVDMLKALVTETPDHNVFISPVSLSAALAMTMNGAAGETFDGMLNTLAFTGMSMDDINAQFQHLLESLEFADEDVSLTLANSIWLNPSYPVKPSFIDAVETWYMSDVFEADSPESLNAWIADKTSGRITDMITEFPADLVMFLVNAIYFKGAWTTEFGTEDTYSTAFTRADSTTVDVDMMAFTDQKEYEAFFNDSVTGIRLPYGRGKIAFYAFAPSEWSEGNIDEFIAGLSGETLNAAIASFGPMELGGVHLPKFKIEYEKELDDILKSFGMESAYEGGFDNMTDPADGNPSISMVKHKAFVEVTETGTEAAAATVVVVVDESAPVRFMANKPFFFVIRDDRNGTILFMGKVADPTAL